MRWMIYGDESGDVGFRIHKGASRTYVVLVYMVEADQAPILRRMVTEHKRLVLGRGGVLEWKNLKSAEKRNDAAIAEFLGAIRESVKILLSATIANKQEMTSETLCDSSQGLLMPYVYGLIFKRIDPFLDKHGATGEFFVDRNSTVNIERNFAEYLDNPLARIINARRNRGTLNTDRRYQGPFFTDMKDPCMQLADFLSGLTRVVFEDYLDRGPLSAYNSSWHELMRWYSQQLPSWRWNGLLYHPFTNRHRHLPLLG